MNTGRPDPIFHRGVAWMKVAIPAAIMAAWIRLRISACPMAGKAAPHMIPMGTVLVTNMASTCCTE